MCEDIKQIGFDIAMIGAGAYGLPLGSYIKKLRRKLYTLEVLPKFILGLKGKDMKLNIITTKLNIMIIG